MPEANLVYVNSPAQLGYKPDAGPTWLRPVACQPISILKETHLDDAYLALAGGWCGFTHLDVITCKNTGVGYHAWRTDITGYLSASHDVENARVALLGLSQPRAPFAGLDITRPHIMGVVNVTPDSFSDGGQFIQIDQALSHARQMHKYGASLLDIGGESTRPGAAPVGIDEECARVLPVISTLSSEGYLVSADTRHPEVMGLSLDAGARIVNDVSGFTSNGARQAMFSAYKRDPDHAFAIAMHMQGTPQTMQENPVYDFVPIDIYEVLKSHINALVTAGLPRTHIAIDPGFGFGKTPHHNRQLIEWTALFHGLGVPMLIGVSRKSSIPVLALQGLGAPPASGYGTDAATQRIGGSITLSIMAAQQGAQIFRTHDVPQTHQALSVLTGLGK